MYAPNIRYECEKNMQNKTKFDENINYKSNANYCIDTILMNNFDFSNG